MTVRLREQIAAELQALLPSYTEFLRELVRMPSQRGSEARCQALVAERMATLGGRVAKIPSRADPNSTNLATRLEGKGGGRSLVLNAHADVAPVEGEWKHPPYDALIEDGMLHGRGAQDDKAGIAVILLVAESLQRVGIRLKGDLVLHSVIEDETTGNGSKALVDAGFGGDGVVICDGTWPERIIHGHLGQIWLDVAITGSPVAACVEQRGVNPIYLACEFIGRLRAWAVAENATAEPFDNVAQPFFVNVGAIHSGVWHGSVPARADLQIQVGFGPERQPSAILQIMMALARSISDRIDVRQGLLATPAVKVPADNALIGRLRPIVERNSGKEVRTQVVTGHCDMRHFGTENICLYGPGAGWNAHGVDEAYRLSDMKVVARNLAELAVSWCGVVSDDDASDAGLADD